MQNQLIFGDNLEVMRDLPSASVDLIATDPPFNSGKDYNIFLKDSLAQSKAFTDIWRWDESAKETRSWIEEQARGAGGGISGLYADLNRTLEGYDLIFNHAIKGPQAEMRSYLAFMGPRLVEMHRLLKPTGSIYLHCDPTASHYLKSLLDIIFGVENFRNEIIWRIGWISGFKTKKRGWIRNHDTILYYLKTEEAAELFNKEYIPYAPDAKRRDGKKPSGKGIPIEDTWNCHSGDRLDSIMIKSFSTEKCGYPTQKTRKLYERIIKASSNPGDIVLDPFCGCGTTIDAAEELERQWIGIDLTNLALGPIEERLLKNHALRVGIDYKILGYPTNMQELWEWVKNKKKYHDLANWAVTRLGLKATKDIGDGGIDGVGFGHVWDGETMKMLPHRIVAEVKTGKINKTQVRAFCQSMTDVDALVGIIISLYPMTTAIKEYQERLGKFMHNEKSYYRLQFWQIDDRYFDNPDSWKQQVKLPWVIKKEGEI